MAQTFGRRAAMLGAVGGLAGITLALAACGPGERRAAAGAAGPPVSPSGSGLSSSTAAPSAAVLGATQTSEAGQVTVKVTWLAAAPAPAFQVALDTHAVDLDRYDLRDLAALRIGDGREVQASAWPASKGGHHREGPLTFPARTADGAPVLGSAVRPIELVIRDLAGVPERRFVWSR